MTASGPRLRVAGAADVPALLDMMADFNRTEAIAWERVSAEAPLQLLLGSPELGLIGLVERGDEVLGYGVLAWGFDLEYAGRDAFLTEFYLRPAARGQGLAAAAMDLLLAEAQRRGVAAGIWSYGTRTRRRCASTRRPASCHRAGCC
jgi:GNAT superfamily N-acetyltransferase